MEREYVAAVDLVAQRKSGEPFPVHIRVGKPFQDPDRKAWRCPVRLDGIDNTLPDLAGGDSFQAICIVLTFIRRRLRDFVDAGGHLWFVENGERFEFPFEAYFPS